MPRGQGLRSISHTQAAALTSPRAGAAPHVARSPKAALTRRSGPRSPWSDRSVIGAGHCSHHGEQLPRAPTPGTSPSQSGFCSPDAAGKLLAGSCRSPRGSRSAGSPTLLAGLTRGPRAPAGWDRPWLRSLRAPSTPPSGARPLGAGPCALAPRSRDSGTSPNPQTPGQGQGGGLGLLGSRPCFGRSRVSREGRVNPRPPLMSLNWE